MFSKDGVVFGSYDVIYIFRVVFFEMHQNLQLYPSLMMKSLFVSDDFNSNDLISLIIVTFQSLTETALSKEL